MTESIDNAERVVPEAEKPDQDFPDGLTKCTADELQSGDTAAGVEHSRCGATHDSKSVIGQREGEDVSPFSGLIEVFGNPGEGLLSDLVTQAANTVPDGERLGNRNLKVRPHYSSGHLSSGFARGLASSTNDWCPQSRYGVPEARRTPRAD